MNYPRPVRGCLYIINFQNGKQYIGVSLFGLRRRIAGHQSDASRRNPQTALHRAMAKYGSESYVARELVVSDDFEYLKELEIKAIRAFRTKVPSGYNMTGGGDGQLGKKWSKESREKLASKRRGVDFMSPDARMVLGKRLRGRKFSLQHRARLSDAGRKRVRRKLGPHSAEHKAKLAAAHIGTKHSAETRAKLSALVKAWWAERTDRSMSEEQKRKISASHLARRVGGLL